MKAMCGAFAFSSAFVAAATSLAWAFTALVCVFTAAVAAVSPACTLARAAACSLLPRVYASKAIFASA